MGVRLALGAGRARLMRQLLTRVPCWPALAEDWGSASNQTTLVGRGSSITLKQGARRRHVLWSFRNDRCASESLLKSRQGFRKPPLEPRTGPANPVGGGRTRRVRIETPSKRQALLKTPVPLLNTLFTGDIGATLATGIVNRADGCARRTSLEDIMSDVIGQNNATVDVPAVQQAVDAGGILVLHGTFNFVNVSLPGPLGTRVILVTRAVTIRGQDVTIVGGGSAAAGGQQAVFLIDAPGADVTIEGLRFVNPHNAAIRVARSGNVKIATCQVDGLTPSAVGVQKAALAIHLPGASVGVISILENRFQLGGAAGDAVGGIIMTGPADRVLIADNRITGTTSHGIDLRDVKGPARVERNIVETGPVGGVVCLASLSMPCV